MLVLLINKTRSYFQTRLEFAHVVSDLFKMGPFSSLSHLQFVLTLTLQTATGNEVAKVMPGCRWPSLSHVKLTAS